MHQIIMLSKGFLTILTSDLISYKKGGSNEFLKIISYFKKNVRYITKLNKNWNLNFMK